MAERRISWTVADAQDARHHGELIVAPSWQAGLELDAEAAFTIVLVEQALAANAALPPAGVIICAPASRVRLPALVAEDRVEYQAGGERQPIRLPKPVRAAYAKGTLHSAQPLATTVRDVFGGGEPRLDLLAREALAATADVRRYWRALHEMLTSPETPPRTPRPQRIRARLREALDSTRSAPPEAAAAIDRVARIAGGAAPDRVAETPAALSEDVALLRCLAEQQEAVPEVASMRAYLERATAPEHAAGVVADRPFLLQQVSFSTLLHGPHQLPSLRASSQHFRDEYARAYAGHHLDYWSARQRLHDELSDAAPAVDTLARLNTLRALGRPVGEDALRAYHALTNVASCVRTDLAAELRERPRCPGCGISMTDTPPIGETADALRAVQAALGQQLARLASAAVRRILARGGKRIDRFLEVAQASDLAGLAQVLDDDLLAFIEALLAEPAEVAQPAPAESPAP